MLINRAKARPEGRRGGWLILLLVLIIIITAFMNREIVSYRDKELAFNLENISRNNSESTSAGLIKRYLLIKKRVEQGVEIDDDYIAESKLQSLLMSNESSHDSVKYKRTFYTNPIRLLTRFYLRGIRFLLGKEMPEDIYMAYNDPFIELAYFYERHRKYERAIEIFNNIFKRERVFTKYTERITLLHTGFCYAMISDYKKAKNAYWKLIKIYPESNEAETAQVLLGFLSTVNRGVKSILNQAVKNIDKAEKLFLISAYSPAKKLFDEYIKKSNKSSPFFIKAKFYRGRSAEEIGDKEAALADYNYVIANSPNSVWAKKSNQRIFILGSVYSSDFKLKNKAVENNKIVKDKNFVKKWDKIKNLINKEKLDVKETEDRYYEYIYEIPEVKEENNDELKKSLHDKKDISEDKISEEPVKEDGIQIKSTSNSKLSREFNRAFERKVIKEKKKYFIGKQISIITKDNDIINGKVIKDYKNFIILKTSIGNVKIKTKNIKVLKEK